MSRLRSWAAARPHLYLVEEPAGTAARLAVERFARQHGWPLVETPADADVLVLAGPPGGVEPYADRVYDQLPGPRARARVTRAEDAAAELEAARAELLDPAAQRADVRRHERPPAGTPSGGMTDDDMGGMGGHDMSDMGGHAGHDMGGPAGQDMGDMGDMGDLSPDTMGGNDMSDMGSHAGHDMGRPADDDMSDTAVDRGGQAGHDMPAHDMPAHDMPAHDMPAHDMGPDQMGGHDMGGHAGHDMGGHAGHDMGGMEMPAGLAMADRAEDRDGLKLDVLTAPWGPALAWWPAGLVVTTVLQGDVVTEVRVEQLGQTDWPAATRHLDTATASVVRRLDALVRLLGVAGWDAPRLTARRLRDDLLDGVPLAERSGELRRLAHKVTRSRALQRMSAQLPVDVVTRYRGWLDDVVTVADGGPSPTAPVPLSDADLARTLGGMELGTARLVLAALDLELTAAHREATVV